MMKTDNNNNENDEKEEFKSLLTKEEANNNDVRNSSSSTNTSIRNNATATAAAATTTTVQLRSSPKNQTERNKTNSSSSSTTTTITISSSNDENNNNTNSNNNKNNNNNNNNKNAKGNNNQNITINRHTLRVAASLAILASIVAFHVGIFLSPPKNLKLPSELRGNMTRFYFKNKLRLKKKTKENYDKKNHNPFEGMKLTREHIHAVQRAAVELIYMLDRYYGGHEQAVQMLTIGGWMAPWDFTVWREDYEQRHGSNSTTSNNTDSNDNDNNDDDEKSKEERKQRESRRLNRLRYDKLVDIVAHALVDDEQDTFIIGTIGSSVAAGHDNCNYDSYERQLQRTFAPVWQAANMTLDVQNAGEGGGCGDSHRNQVFCIKQNVSPFVDVVHYSWTYFGESKNERESLIRWSQMLPHQPPVHHLLARGSEDRCYYNEKKGTANREEVLLSELYAMYGFNTMCLQSALYAGGYNYSNDEENRFGWGYVGDGYHNTTRYGELETNPERRDSLGTVFRNWHPGPLGFQVVSDAFAYVYSGAILRALQLIEDAMEDGIDPRSLWGNEHRPVTMKHDLPEPLFCNGKYCTVEEAPGCLNMELPTYGWHGASVIPKDDPFNPYRISDSNDDNDNNDNENNQKVPQNWERWIQPKGDFTLVDKVDTQIYNNNSKFCRHLDQCGGLRGTSSTEHGRLVLQLPKMEVGLVVLCGCCGKQVADGMFMKNNDNLEIKYNNVRLTNDTWSIWPESKCVRIMDGFPNHGEPDFGHSYLSIRLLDGNEKEITISHVITL